MTIPFETIALVALIITFAYIVFGLTGFGSSITAMPLLVQFVPLQVAVPVMLILDLCAGLLLVLKNYRYADRRELMRLLPYMLIGMLLGVTLLIKAPERILLLVLGFFVLAYSGWSLLVRPKSKPIDTGWAVPTGAVGGVFTALFGTGGPIYAIYLARRIGDKLALRATNGSLILISAFGRLVLFTGVGLYSRNEVLELVVLMIPCALLGLYVGTHLHHRLPAQRVVQVIWCILILGGTSLVVRNF